MALVIVPLVAWIVCLRLLLGRGDDVGSRNFGFPFAGLTNKLQQSVSQLIAGGYPAVIARFDLCVLVGLVAQFFFFAFHRRWHDPWWRVGACYAVLMAFLGDAVWEDYPSAAARVLLPMTLAFNITVPRGRWWLILIVAATSGSSPRRTSSSRRAGRASSWSAPGRSDQPQGPSVVEAIYEPDQLVAAGETALDHLGILPLEHG